MAGTWACEMWNRIGVGLKSYPWFKTTFKFKECGPIRNE